MGTGNQTMDTIEPKKRWYPIISIKLLFFIFQLSFYFSFMLVHFWNRNIQTAVVFLPQVYNRMLSSLDSVHGVFKWKIHFYDLAILPSIFIYMAIRKKAMCSKYPFEVRLLPWQSYTWIVRLIDWTKFFCSGSICHRDDVGEAEHNKVGDGPSDLKIFLTTT